MDIKYDYKTIWDITVLIKNKSFYDCCTLQEHQRIRTNATVSKDSDLSVLMVVYEIIFFTFFKQISEINK